MRAIHVVVLSVHCSLFAFAVSAVGAQDDPIRLQLDTAPTDVQVSLYDGSIIVSAGQELLLLNPDFTLNSSVPTHDRRVGQRIALSRNASDVVLVCKEGYCTHYTVDWEYEEILVSSEQVGRGFGSVPLSTEPNGFYIGTSDSSSFKVEQINEDGFFMHDYHQFFRNTNFYQRQFLHGFEYGIFVYFVVQDNGTNDVTNNIRVMRFCHDLEQPAFNAAFEAILDCGVMSPNSKVGVANSLLDEFGNASITFAVTTTDETNIYSFLLDDINTEMDASFTKCSTNGTLTFSLPWYSERTCFAFSIPDLNMCEFDLSNELNGIPALATFNAVHGQHLLRFNQSEEITAVLTVKVGLAVELLFVAYSNSSSSGHFVDKYHIKNDSDLELVSRDQHNLPVNLLRWNEIMEEIYGANADSVFEIPLARCSNYTSCTDCASSRDPLCGWCALEQYCSRDIYCPGGSHKGHWVNNAEQCIVSVSLAINSMDVDLIENAELIVNPQPASLPSSPVQGYQCNFYHGNRENASYIITAPLSGSACQLQQAQIDDFTGKHIDLTFSLQTTSHAMELFSSLSVLVLHNCSLHTDCGSCVEASLSCGWCVHDRTCTGNKTRCRHEDDWRSLADTQQEDVHVCPVVVTPDHGSYTLPVAVRKELTLSTLNFPSEIPGYGYGCQIKYADAGYTFQLKADYHNDTEFRCITAEDQVYMSSDVVNGSEAALLEILWIRKSDNFTVALHSVKVTLYDCSQLGTDCSNCMSTNLGTGFECIWCDKQQTEDECTILDYCRIESTVTNHITRCPLPTITLISPKSGPTLGGTVLTITGSNLGAEATDVSVELIKFAAIPCIADYNKYIPGIQIVCTTQEASEGDHLVRVNVRREDTVIAPSPMLAHTFTYAHPIINSVEPRQGPKAGGTEIMILGSNLDISSGSAQVYIGDVHCDIQLVTSTVIVCISRPVATASASHRTRVIIDNADMPSELYNYTENPVFTKVEPQNIIPAGGVTLTFRGNHLDVVLHPELIITIDNYTLTSACTPKSRTELRCVAPKLPTGLSINNTEQRRLQQTTVETLSYTIIMDGADGPMSTDEGLQLTVKPNPVFFMLHTEDREYTLESERSIRILGANIDSVLSSELSVMIDNAACMVVRNDITPSQIRCFPPDTVSPGDRPVKVFVGVSGLNYSVGFLRYSKASSGGGNNDLLIIIIPAMMGVIVLMLTALAVLCCIVGVMIRRKRAYKAKRRSALRDENKNEVDLVSNVYNGSRRVVHGGQHDYDTIPDVLEQIQLQQLEIITCAAQHRTTVPHIDITATKISGNIYSSEDEGRGSSATSSDHHSSRPNSSSMSAGSRPRSSSMTGSLSLRHMKRPPLPPLPTSLSDEYVAMHSYMLDNPTAVEDTDIKPAAITATAVIHKPAAEKTENAAANIRYDKLASKTQKMPEDTVVTADSSLVDTLPDQRKQEESTA